MTHLIVYLFCIGAPLSTFYLHRYLRQHPSDRIKERCYISVYILYALLTWFAVGTRPWSELWRSPVINMPDWLVWIGAAGLTLYVVLNAVELAGLRRPAFREAVAKVFEDKAWLLPQGRRQIGMFYAISIVVGFAEELFFRGYLTRYLMDTPYSLSWPAVAAVLGVLFGAGHFPQGWKAALSSGINGLLYWWLYAWTGSIWAPVVLHVLYDARIGFISSVIHKKTT